MAYSADSFTALEVPTLAKMNKLWSNDASFNDGTGIADDKIIARHILDNSLTRTHIDWAAATGKIWWEELARASLASPATTLASGTFTARKYLLILVIAKPSGAAITPWFRFNGDSGNNYALRYGANYATGTGLGSQNGMSFNPNSIQTSVFAQIFVENETAAEKPIYISASDLSSAGAANIPNIIQSNGKWANTSSQITAFSIFNSGSANNFGAGSEIVVLGHD